MAQEERTHVRKEQFGTFGFEADRDGSSAFKVMLQAPLSMVLLWAHGWCGLGGISEVSPSQPKVGCQSHSDDAYPCQVRLRPCGTSAVLGWGLESTQRAQQGIARLSSGGRTKAQIPQRSGARTRSGQFSGEKTPKNWGKLNQNGEIVD